MNNLSKAFSLIELLIVIFLLSLVTFLGINGVSLSKPKPKPLTLLTLKDRLKKELKDGGVFICIDKNRECFIKDNFSSSFTPYKNISFKETQVYILDKNEELLKKEYGRFDDEKISLVINFYKNQSSSQMIIEEENRAIFLPAFFGKTKEFDNIEDAKEYWLKNREKIKDREDFY